ncbi:hypothetical protein GCM10007285_00230 [Stappia taiwanensis]|nr:hypothetical protein GCM10007285_00230 [Stappia taiwanensis]
MKRAIKRRVKEEKEEDRRPRKTPPRRRATARNTENGDHPAQRRTRCARPAGTFQKGERKWISAKVR